MRLKLHKKKDARLRRHKRIRATVKGTLTRPRLAMYRSNKYMHAQLVDDENGFTLIGFVSRGIAGSNKVEQAREAGKKFADMARKQGKSDVVFDRGGFSYHGRVKAFSDGAREGGLKF